MTIPSLNHNLFYCLLAVILTLAGCGPEAEFQADIDQGIIEYDVSYSELDSNNIMLEMLPSKMIMIFKDDKYISKLETTAGIVEMAVLADQKNQRMYNLVKIFSDRYALELDKTEALEMTNVFPQFVLNITDEEKVIAEANCQKAELEFDGSSHKDYIFYFTDEISLKDPNWCTPYYDIKGVLLDYRIQNYGMNMRLKATRITPKEIDDSEFEISDDYEFLTRSEFDELVVKNMEIFME